MSTIIEGTMPVEVAGIKIDQVRLTQTSDSGEEQAVHLGLHQMEELASWLQEYVRSSREEMAQE